MKHLCPVIALIFLAALLPAVAVAADNGTADTNLTPVSVSQNATVSVPSSTVVGLAKIGTFENATVYVSGGANATLNGDRLAVYMGEAPRMDYRDVYLLYRIPSGFQSFSFDYDLAVGEKSNALLVDFYDGTPKVGVKKGGIPDRSIVGLGTWTSRGYEIGGISGLKPFPQGAHHVEIVPGDMLYLKVDGNITAFGYYSQQKYLLLHLMTGDENSYIRGTLSNLKYEGPSLDNGTALPGTSNSTSGISGIPNTTINSSVNSSGGKQNGSGDKETGATEQGTSQPLIGLNIWLALAAGAGFFIAWAIVYYKYLSR
jgi:hypothetical protein